MSPGGSGAALCSSWLLRNHLDALLSFHISHLNDNHLYFQLHISFLLRGKKISCLLPWWNKKLHSQTIWYISPFSKLKILATAVELLKAAHDCWISERFSTICYKCSDDTALCVSCIFSVSCVYCIVENLRLPDGHNLITSLYPPAHSAPGAEQTFCGISVCSKTQCALWTKEEEECNHSSRVRPILQSAALRGGILSSRSGRKSLKVVNQWSEINLWMKALTM